MRRPVPLRRGLSRQANPPQVVDRHSSGKSRLTGVSRPRRYLPHRRCEELSSGSVRNQGNCFPTVRAHRTVTHEGHTARPIPSDMPTPMWCNSVGQVGKAKEGLRDGSVWRQRVKNLREAIEQERMSIGIAIKLGEGVLQQRGQEIGDTIFQLGLVLAEKGQRDEAIRMITVATSG